MLKDLLWNPVWKEKQAESELIGLVNGDSCEGEGWKLVTSGTIKKGPALLTDLQLQIGFSALVLGLGALSCLGRRALKSEHQGKGGDSTESGKEVVDQDGKKREISTRKALVNRAERSPPQTMHKSKKQLSTRLHWESFNSFPGKPSQWGVCTCTLTYTAWGIKGGIKVWVQLKSCSLNRNMEAWWDSSYNCSGYRLPRKDRSGCWEGGVSFCVREQQRCTELCLVMHEDQDESL